MRSSVLLGVLLATAAAGCSGDDGTDAPPVDPNVIVTPESEWTWVDFPGSQCGDGSATGIAVSRRSDSDRVLIYLQGGGACYDVPGCTGPDPAASHFDGYGPDELEEAKADELLHGVFDRSDADNPFRSYNQVFVPYCTGDVHSGDNVYGDLHFKGHTNLQAFLARLVPTFADAEQVVLAGSSAGGLGSMYNYQLVANAFGDTPTLLVDDSGPFFPLSATPELIVVVTIWGLENTIASGCDNCIDMGADDAGLHNLIPLYAEQFPGRRMSLISSVRDETITEFFLLETAEFEAAITTLADATVPENPDMRVFYLEGDHHVWLDGDETTNKLGDVVSNGFTLSSFLAAQLEGGADFANVRP
jgi:hypothetical protein